jgi:peptidoglycan-N-acetylglucosamine deacetylase
MNILTFDIEDWYNTDFKISNSKWDQYEVRIYDGVERILEELAERDIKATFFCLGWIAKKHPRIIRWINDHGHHIGCHSFKHELSHHFDRNGFKKDTEKAKKLIEDVSGGAVNAFRAPGFSISERNMWAFEVLTELEFRYDSSIFPAKHDYGGFRAFGKPTPALVKVPNGAIIREFPMNTAKILGQDIIFSGGGFFRLLPYWLIKRLAKESEYMMTYFHPRDFDPDQPILQSLSLRRRAKSYVGLSTSYPKFKQLLNDFSLISVEEADTLIDWSRVQIIGSK